MSSCFRFYDYLNVCVFVKGLKSERMNDGVAAPHKAIFIKVTDMSAMSCTCELTVLTDAKI